MNKAEPEALLLSVLGPSGARLGVRVEVGGETVGEEGVRVWEPGALSDVENLSSSDPDAVALNTG